MRAYGQRDPLNEYKSEAFTLFDNLLTSLREDVTKAMMNLLLNVQMQRQQRAQSEQQAATQQAAQNASQTLNNESGQNTAPAARRARSPMDMVGTATASGASASEAPSNSDLDAEPTQASTGELTKEQLIGVSRNSLCPCGSGKKFKHCHGKL